MFVLTFTALLESAGYVARLHMLAAPGRAPCRLPSHRPLHMHIQGPHADRVATQACKRQMSHHVNDWCKLCCLLAEKTSLLDGFVMMFSVGSADIAMQLFLIVTPTLLALVVNAPSIAVVSGPLA